MAIEGGAAVTITIRDDGVAFDPTAAAVPDLTGKLEDRPVGGLGMFLVAKLSESFRYERLGSCNVTTVVMAVPHAVA